jgi:hypothetical protein
VVVWLSLSLAHTHTHTNTQPCIHLAHILKYATYTQAYIYIYYITTYTTIHTYTTYIYYIHILHTYTTYVQLHTYTRPKAYILACTVYACAVYTCVCTLCTLAHRRQKSRDMGRIAHVGYHDQRPLRSVALPRDVFAGITPTCSHTHTHTHTHTHEHKNTTHTHDTRSRTRTHTASTPAKHAQDKTPVCQHKTLNPRP